MKEDGEVVVVMRIFWGGGLDYIKIRLGKDKSNRFWFLIIILSTCLWLILWWEQSRLDLMNINCWYSNCAQQTISWEICSDVVSDISWIFRMQSGYEYVHQSPDKCVSNISCICCLLNFRPAAGAHWLPAFWPLVWLKEMLTNIWIGLL